MPATFDQEVAAHLKQATDAKHPSFSADLRKRIRDALQRFQLAFIDDPAGRKSLRVPRRGGKSFTLAAYLIDTCLKKAGARCVFGSITLKSAKRLIWDGADGLKRFCTKYGIPIKEKATDEGVDFNNSSVTATFPNGSVIMVMGFETDADIDKIRGDKLDLVILDECKSFPLSLFKELIEQAIEPALMDKDGVLCVAGTPGARKAGIFYDATWVDGALIQIDEETKEDREKEGLPPVRYAINRPYDQSDQPQWQGVDVTWSCHSWTIADNTAFKVRRRDGKLVTLWEQALETKRRNRWGDTHPVWLREYMGHWVEDTSAFVYHPSAANLWTPQPTKESPLGLPLAKGRTWHFGAGLDLGWTHPTCIEVLAWCDDLPFFWQVYEAQGVHLTQKSVVAMIRHARDVVGQEFDFIVADTGNLGAEMVASIEEEYGLGLEAAKKTDKNAFVEIVNSEFGEGRAFIIKGSRLHDEMTALTWDVPRGVVDLGQKGAPVIKKYEDENCANDHCDAYVYAARRAMHKFARSRPPEPKPGSPEWQAERDAEEWTQMTTEQQQDIDGYGSEMAIDGYGDSTW